jgi:tetratricopeptide (TPR) repeat protein
MSFIHDALKKAQKEKDGRYGEYHGIVSTPGYKPRLFSGKALWCASFLLISLAFTAYLWFPSREAQPPIRERGRPEATLQPESQSPVPSPLREKDRPALARRAQNNLLSLQSRSGPGARVKKNGTRKKLLGTSLYKKARRFQKSGRFQEAKRLYEETLSVDPDYVDALNNLGVIHIHDKNYSAARAIFAKAIRLKPGYVDSYYNLACLHALKGELTQGLSQLKKAASLDQSVKEWARTDSDLQNLRRVPEFEEIIRSNGGVE